MKSEVYFVDEKLKESFESLKEGKFEDKRLYEYINRAIEDLKKRFEFWNSYTKEVDSKRL